MPTRSLAVVLLLTGCRPPVETTTPGSAAPPVAEGAPPPAEPPRDTAADVEEEVEEEIPEEDVRSELDPPMRSGSERRDSSTLKPVADADALQISPTEAKAAAIFAPDPRRAWLDATAAAKAKRPVRGVVRYCIDAGGRTLGIETRTPGDAEVDHVLRDTVASWRFRPIERDGKPRLVCTTETFDVHFD